MDFNNVSAITQACNGIGDVNGILCVDFPFKNPKSVDIFVWIAFSALITISLIGNGIVMFIIYNFKIMQYGFNYFLFNMALSDFLIALLNAGSTWTYNYYHDWWYPSEFCAVNNFFGVAPSCSSLFSLVVISHDRCKAIVNPLHKKSLRRKTALMIISAVWVISCIISLPNILGARVETIYVMTLDSEHYTKRRLCHNIFKYKILYESLLFVFQYICPLIVLSYTYVRIYTALNKLDIPNSSKTHRMRDKQKVVKMLGLITVLFFVCFLPYQIYNLSSDYLEVNNPIIHINLTILFYWLAMSSTMYNPIIYCIFNARFRIGFTYVFRFLPFINFTEDHYNKMFPNSRNATVMRKLTSSASTPIRLTSTPPRLHRSGSPNSAMSLNFSLAPNLL